MHVDVGCVLEMEPTALTDAKSEGWRETKVEFPGSGLSI